MSDVIQCPACNESVPVGDVHACPVRAATEPLRLEVNGNAPLLHEHHNAQPHSVELSLTAAGKVSASVKVYDDDPHSAFTRAAAVFDEVRKRYPNAEGK